MVSQVYMSVQTSQLTWQCEGEIESSQHNSSKDPPSKDIDNECTSSACNDQLVCKSCVSLSQMPVCASKTAERWDQEGEDEEEDEVSA